MGVAQSRTAAGREPRPDREDRLIDGDDLALFIASAPPTLRVEGEFDMTNGPTLARVLRARLAAGPRLRVDLGGVTFADVGSLREIYQIAAGLQARGQITLANATEPVRRALELAGFRARTVVIET
jgi:anti-anti-sigma factor